MLEEKLMKKMFIPVLFVVGAVLLAQSANDVGTPANPTGPYFTTGSPYRGTNCPPDDFVISSFSGANTQLGRIYRDGIASSCPTKVYPGIFNAATTYNYEAFTYTNTSSSPACVTVNFDPDTVGGACTTNAHASAYANSYNPTNQAANFLGDVGSSTAQPFSFEVPAGADLVLVVTNTASQSTCSFSFQVVNLPCLMLPPVPTLGQWGLIALLALLLATGILLVRRKRQNAAV